MYRLLYCVGEVQIAGDVAKARDVDLAELRRARKRVELGERDYYSDKDYRYVLPPSPCRLNPPHTPQFPQISPRCLHAPTEPSLDARDQEVSPLRSRRSRARD